MLRRRGVGAAGRERMGGAWQRRRGIGESARRRDAAAQGSSRDGPSRPRGHRTPRWPSMPRAAARMDLWKGPALTRQLWKPLNSIPTPAWKKLARLVAWPLRTGWPDEGRRIVQGPIFSRLIDRAAPTAARGFTIL